MHLKQCITAILCLWLISVTRAADDVPRFEPADYCPLKAALTAPFECGTLVVPADRSQPDGPTLRLMVAVHRSTHQTKLPDPIIFLNGGPGGSTVIDANVWMHIFGSFADRDLIFFDQRGTGFSDPQMECPELAVNTLGRLRKHRTPDEDRIKGMAAAQACHDRLLDKGVDFTVVNSAASAADVNDLWHTLGYTQANLIGVSYGTRLALTVMRDYPDGIRSVILDSVYPPGVDGIAELLPNQQAIFAKVFAACAAVSACNEKYPDLETVFYDLVDRWNAEPVTLTAPAPAWQVDGGVLMDALFAALYSPTVIPEVPRLIYAFYQGDTTELSTLVTLLTPQPDDRMSMAMSYTVQCREEVPFTDADAIQHPSTPLKPVIAQAMQDMLAGSQAVCDFWGSGQADPQENQPVVSDIPALLLTGEFDPITPASYADYAASTLSHSYNVQVAQVSHAVLFQNLGICAQLMSLEFLDDPSHAPEQKCTASLPVDFH